VHFRQATHRYVWTLAPDARTAYLRDVARSNAIALAHAAKALALFDGEEYVRPEHVHELAVTVLAHRMVLDPQAKFAGATGQALVADVLREVKVPS